MFNDLYLGVHVRLTPQACRTDVIFLCFSVEAEASARRQEVRVTRERRGAKKITATST